MIIACTACGVAMRVSEGVVGEAHSLVGPGSEFWPDKYQCFKCSAPAMGMHEAEIESAALVALQIVNVSPDEAYAALNGLGIPSEKTCCLEVLAPLFEAKGITVHGREVKNSARFFIDHLEFSDGTKVYFASSANGAVIYRIAAPHSYTEKVLNDST